MKKSIMLGFPLITLIGLVVLVNVTASEEHWYNIVYLITIGFIILLGTMINNIFEGKSNNVARCVLLMLANVLLFISHFSIYIYVITLVLICYALARPISKREPTHE